MTPFDAPAGVTLKFLPRPSATNTAWDAWRASYPTGTYWESRQIIQPRLLLVHTNAATNPGTKDAAYNVSMSAPGTTKAHYQVDRDGSCYKFLPSDRRGIANGTKTSDPRTGGENVAMWSLAIETADLGYGADKPGGACGFTPEQGEMVAQIIAFESAMWNFPIEYPATWDGTGVACHTEPFEYPYWTIYTGKTCPGWQKKIDMVEWIMPRAIEIRYGNPLPIPGDEEDMELVQVPGDAAIYARSGFFLEWMGPNVDSALKDGVIFQPGAQPRMLASKLSLKGFTLIGSLPDYGNGPGNGPTNASHFNAVLG